MTVTDGKRGPNFSVWEALSWASGVFDDWKWNLTTH